MSKMIQVRNVPDDMHRMLKMQAAAEGMSLSDFVKRELGVMSGLLPFEEIAARSVAGNSALARRLELIGEG